MTDTWNATQHFQIQIARNTTHLACLHLENALSTLDLSNDVESIADLADGLARTLSVLRTDLTIIDNAIREHL